MADLTDLVTEAVAVLEAGGVVLLPTDTVYGLAARAEDHAAVAKLFDLKDRPADRTIAVLVSTRSQAASLAELDPDAARAAAQHWPGALTLVLPAGAGAPPAVVSDIGHVGLRQPGSVLVRLIAERVGPLATTSANRAGLPTPTNARACAAQLTGDADLVIDGGELTGEASTVVQRRKGEWVLLREGGIAAAALVELFGPPDRDASE